jgi:hypothetical protein
MRKAGIADKEQIIDSISTTFETNPGVYWLLKQSGNRSRKIRLRTSNAGS